MEGKNVGSVVGLVGIKLGLSVDGDTVGIIVGISVGKNEGDIVGEKEGGVVG